MLASSPSRTSHEASIRRPGGVPFHMHGDEDVDSFYISRKSGDLDDLEVGCLVPSEMDDAAVSDLPALRSTTNSSRPRRVYAAYRHWLPRLGSPRTSAAQFGEKGAEPPLGGSRAAKTWRRMQAGSLCAMFIFALLAVYFLMHEA